jgi:general L-amino acid transport system permease protein
MEPVLTEAQLVPPPEPERPPADGAGDWVRRNLLRSPLDAVVTVVAAAVVGYVLYRLGRYVFVTGRWEIIRVNLKLFMVGRYPVAELWRVSVVLVAIAGYIGLVAGFVSSRRRRMGLDPETHAPWWRRTLAVSGRLWPLLAGTLLLLLLCTTAGPWLMVGAAIVAAALGRLGGARLPKRSTLPLLALGVAGFVGAVWFLLQALGWDKWGGLMLNLFLAFTGILLCFPVGVALALGRRSKLPLIRWLCTGYIELFRGVPLFVLLLLSNIALGLFWPADDDWRSTAFGLVPDRPPGFVVRAIVAMALFTAAYVAEIVRGGLQSLPRGQSEAATALGLGPVRVTFLIVLPQALRNVIPALVGQFISLFKDTTLAAAAMGFLDLYGVREAVTSQTGFQGQNLTPEVLSFVMLVFWIGCITMSRESQRLERKLGVGSR